jgi:hypothetical protein
MFLDKLSKFNQNISYIIFALNGYLALLLYIIFHMDSDNANVVAFFLFNATITAILCFTGIVWCIEQITKYKIQFVFLKHKPCTIILLFGAIISTIYLFLLALFLIYGFIVMPIIS